MRKLYKTTSILLFLLLSLPATAQLRKEYFKTDQLIYDEPDKRYLGEFLDKELWIYDTLLSSNCGCEIPDLSIGWGSSLAINYTLNNLNLVEKARENAYNTWYNRQLNEVIKPAIEKKLGKTFTNFNEAKDAIFKHTEKYNLDHNLPPKKSEYYTKVRENKDYQVVKLKDLLVLKVRRRELEMNSNYNTTFNDYHYKAINNTSIRYINDLNAINKVQNTTNSDFEANNINQHFNEGIYNILNSTNSINSGVLLAKNQTFNTFSKWDRLNYMQILLNWEAVHNYYTFPYLPPKNLQKFFLKIDIATPYYIDNYAKKQYELNADDYMSVFDDDYYLKLLGLSGAGMHLGEDHYRALAHNELKEKTLNNLLDKTSIGATKKVDYLITMLHLDDKQSAEWLSDNLEVTNYYLDMYRGMYKQHPGLAFENVDWMKGVITVDAILDGNFTVKSTNKHPEELNDCCPGDCCPNETMYSFDPIITEYGIAPFQSGVDAYFNLIISPAFSFYFSEDRIGRAVRRIMKEIGIEVPDDVSNEYLSAVYQIRKRDGVVIVEYRPGLLKSMIEVGLNTLDILAILSPSKGGGAFLAVKAGGVSITAITKYLRAIAKGNWIHTNESMSDAAKLYQEFISGRKWNESFKLNNVKFDGLKDGVLSDAKSGMLNFVDNATGKFKIWFSESKTGGVSLKDQARRQLIAAEGNPVVWHFQNKAVRDATEKLFEGLSLNIILKHTPN